MEEINIYGYMRVSSKEQNEDRQKIALTEMGVPENNIYMDICLRFCAENRSGKSADCDKPTSDCKFVVFRLCQISG